MSRQFLSEADKQALISRNILKPDDATPDMFANQELQKLQDQFCAASGLYSICFGKNIGVLTSFSGPKKDRAVLERVIGEKYYYAVLKKMQFSEHQKEIYVFDTTYPFIKIAGVNVIADGVVIASWILTAILDDVCKEEDKHLLKFFSHTTNRKEFRKSLDFLNTISKKLFEIRVGSAGYRLDYSTDELLRECLKFMERRDGVMSDLITLNGIYKDKIDRYANYDSLTGLYNRMRCERDLEKIVKQSISGGGRGALIYIDLDDFKSINDGLGHRSGDLLLKTVAEKLRNITEISETCYRMGGDEFMVIVSDQYFDSLSRVVANIKEIFQEPWIIDTMEYYCSLSMGIVQFPEDGSNFLDVMKKADIALYEAKRHGKNRVEYFDKTSEASSYKRLDMESKLRKAVANGCAEFEVYYQPVFDMQKEGLHKCCGAEALVRWNSKELGMIRPDEFVPLAEYLGLINPIGTYVLEKACTDCKSWNDRGFEYKVNVNLSVVQLLQNNICDIISDVLVKTGLNPKNLTLEVTESLAINDMERMKKILGSIKERGVRIALDDFGTGYSSLNHIKEMPLDVIKVDQCFVSGISKDEYAHAFVKMVTELANTINVTVCVEGVENNSQQQVLKDLKVRLHQGYYYDKPLSVADYESKYVNDVKSSFLSYKFTRAKAG